MDSHVALGHSEAYGWEVHLTCNDCGNEAEGDFYEVIDGETVDICNECGENDVYLSPED
jgi:hypothetical protein